MRSKKDQIFKQCGQVYIDKMKIFKTSTLFTHIMSLYSFVVNYVASHKFVVLVN